MDDLQFDREIFLNKPVIYLSDLAKKDPRVLTRKSYLYLYNVLTVAVFYGLPVVQLVFTYQNVLNQTGQQDLCYYNFLCAHPLGFFSDFNHLFSNVGYGLFGLLFLGIVYRREVLHQDINFDRVSIFFIHTQILFVYSNILFSHAFCTKFSVCYSIHIVAAILFTTDEF